MNINVLKSNNPYLSNNKLTKLELQKSVTSLKTNSEIKENSANKNTVNTTNTINKININKLEPNEVISKSERQYFVKLFPDSSSQIEKHVLFNRNGKIVESNMRKGGIFDAIG